MAENMLDFCWMSGLNSTIKLEKFEVNITKGKSVDI